MESLLAVVEGDPFDLEPLVAEALARWPGSGFARTEGPRARLSFGQLQLADDDGIEDRLLVSLMAEGDGMRLEGDEGLASSFVAWVTGRAGFPEDGSVVLTDWAEDLYPLRPGMAADEIRGAFLA
ncbi:hypothetical protein ACWFNE_02860 [Cellulomonas sp. NPDC055163]